MIMIDDGVGALGTVVEDVEGTVVEDVEGTVVEDVEGTVGCDVEAVVDGAVVTGVLAAVGALPFVALEQLVPTTARTMAAESSH
jgi:hypothetical protein